jgi:glycosyltransferase involved in cell wall biosynthesis
MRLLILSYDLDDLGGSGTTLRIVAIDLERRGHGVWTTAVSPTQEELRGAGPELIISQQWATEEASRWATALQVPFVMLVHGPGQYEQFMAPCDLVVFDTFAERELARKALGVTPTFVLHPPVFRDDYATDGAGNCLTLIGGDSLKGVDVFLDLARGLPEEQFLLVTDVPVDERLPNVDMQPRARDARRVYAQTKLLLMPSRQESYGRVAVEAAMSGIPTVASDLPGIREATIDRAVYVAKGESWESRVRAVLADLPAARERARAIAALRDPSAELDALDQRLRRVATAGRRR